MDLTSFTDDQLLAVIRNPAAHARTDAIRYLLERASPHAEHPDIIGEAANLQQTDPQILGGWMRRRPIILTRNGEGREEVVFTPWQEAAVSGGGLSEL